MQNVQQRITHNKCNHTAFPLFFNSTGSMFSTAPGKQVPPLTPSPRRGVYRRSYGLCTNLFFSQLKTYKNKMKIWSY